jgi:ABC-type multidrug transport system permease subunit
MPRLLEVISNFLPLTYAVDATKKVISGSGGFTTDFTIIAIFLIALLGLGSVSLKRKSK